ncbi:MAG: CoA-binding protein [Planctomycetes bacterium]|nr:CoA-binding protein [Planctomycetota bacterium]
MNVQERIKDFLAGTTYAVVGASSNREKYGNKVLRCYQQHGREVFAVHPRETDIEGAPTVTELAKLPKPVHGVSIITPPAVTEKVVEEAARLGVKRIWMQPGAESPKAVARAEELGLSVIANGPCLLVSLGYREH